MCSQVIKPDKHILLRRAVEGRGWRTVEDPKHPSDSSKGA